MKPALKRVALTWRHDLVFQGVGAGNAPITVDGDNAQGPGPMESLLLALAACTGSDVVGILRKKRVALATFEVRVEGERRQEYPQRYVAIRLTYDFTAPGLTREAAEQAVALSLEKYCSVTHSLNPDIPITHEIVIRA